MHDRLFRLADVIEGYRFASASEDLIADGVDAALLRAGEEVEREVVLGPHERVDFLTPDGICIEVKVGGSLMDLVRQLQRYAQHERVRALLVVTNRSKLLGVPPELSGKPIAVASLLSGGLG